MPLFSRKQDRWHLRKGLFSEVTSSVGLSSKGAGSDTLLVGLFSTVGEVRWEKEGGRDQFNMPFN